MLLRIQNGLQGEIVLDASQVVICCDNGTPIAAAVAYGPDQAVKIGVAGGYQGSGADFERLLKYCQVPGNVEVTNFKVPAGPPGARLIT